jgi:hypothetical protein
MQREADNYVDGMNASTYQWVESVMKWI